MEHMVSLRALLSGVAARPSSIRGGESDSHSVPKIASVAANGQLEAAGADFMELMQRMLAQHGDDGRGRGEDDTT